MRDNGCYFFDDGEGGEAQKIRDNLGRFDIRNIPKLMSRMGQCFTQAEVPFWKQCFEFFDRKIFWYFCSGAVRCYCAKSTIKLTILLEAKMQTENLILSQTVLENSPLISHLG